MLIIPETEKSKTSLPRMKIWKFYLGVGPETTVTLPKGAQVLSVGTQDELIHMWAIVDPDAARIEKNFHIVSTGEPCEHVRGMKFCGMAMMHGGSLIFHIFEGVDEFPARGK